MSSTDLHVPDNFADAERFQRLFVLPVVQGVEDRLKTMLQPVIDQHQAQAGQIKQNTEDIATLKTDQKKALLGWSAYATAAAVLVGSAWGYIKSHVRFG